MTITTEHPAAVTTTTVGIRYTRPGDEPRTDPIGHRGLRDQLVVELRTEGATAEPVLIHTRVEVEEDVSARLDRDVARQSVLHIAQLVFEGEVLPEAAVLDLAQFSTLDEAGRAEKLADLVHELEWQEQVERGDYDTGLCAPGEDRQALAENAERRVTDAANALIGGAA